MRWVLPGGLCSTVTLLLGRIVQFWSNKRLRTLKLVLEILAVLVGLIVAILALFGLPRK
jgi:hypothetical protein